MSTSTWRQTCLLMPLSALFACSFGLVNAQLPPQPRVIYQGGPEVEYLRIEKLPDPHVVPMPTHPVTIKTKEGEVKLLRLFNGNCDTIFKRLLTTPRVSVEVKDESFYSVLLEHGTAQGHLRRQILGKLVTILGLSMEQHPRKMHAFVLSDNGEEPTGVSKDGWARQWPEVARLQHESLPMSDQVRPILVRRYPGGGCVFVRTNYTGEPEDNDKNVYFDNIPFDELADYLEDKVRWIPVVNCSEVKGRRSFSLPRGTYKEFMFDAPYRLPGLGLSVEYRQVKIDVFVIRQQTSARDDGAVRARDTVNR